MQNQITITAGDFLAGGGGVTYAMKKIPGMECRWVLNHDKKALRTNMYNNKGIKHYWADFYNQNEHEMEQVDFTWASIECDTHCRANGGKIKRFGSYMMGMELVRYVRHINPHVVGIENVPEYKNWGPVRIKQNHKESTESYSSLMLEDDAFVYEPIKSRKGEYFENWKETIKAMGYNYHEKIMNAADYGIPTRRVRFFCWFTRSSLGLEVTWPTQTHNKKGTDGLKKHVACKKYIDLSKEGQSIFGRRFNPNILPQHRKELAINSQRRVAGGVRKYAPEIYFIMQYYGTGLNVQSTTAPLNTIPCNDRHVLLKIEKAQFIQDYCRSDFYCGLDESLNTQVTWQTKQLVTLEKKEFISDSTYSTADKNFPLEEAFNSITGEQRHQLVTAELSATTEEKFQFISSYFNSNGNPESQNQSIDAPLNAVLTETNKKALVTAIQKGLIDFDIKMRFLEPEELSRVSSFPKGYFTNPKLNLSKKDATRLIGNAVPPEWARLIIKPVVEELRRVLKNEVLKLKVA